MLRTINLDKETNEMLEAMSKKYHISRSATVRQLIAEKYGKTA